MPVDPYTLSLIDLIDEQHTKTPFYESRRLMAWLNQMGHTHKGRDDGKPWVFWHCYWSRKIGYWAKGPYTDRKKLMKQLCGKAEVKYFRYHALRHFGASMIDHDKVPIGTVQRILGIKID